MPKLKPDTHRPRRVLDAAQICFARSGFDRTTMQDICKEAVVSPGALYVYFGSKEDLIAGIVERDRAKLAGELAALAEAPDLLAALSKLGEHYTVEEPQHKRLLCVEIGLKSTRNGAVGELFRSVDKFCHDSFIKLFDRAKRDGRIARSTISTPSPRCCPSSATACSGGAPSTRISTPKPSCLCSPASCPIC